MNKKIIIVIVVILLSLIGAGYLFVNKSDIINNPKNTINSNNENQTEPVVNIDKAAEKIFLDKEIQLKIDFLNKALKPNYLKIVDYQESDHLLKYKDNSVTWFVMKIAYDINDKSLADYDIYINKGSLSISDYNTKGTLYKENLARQMKNVYYKSHGYDRLVKTGILGYLTKDGSVYTMYELGDYINNTFKGNIIDVELLSKIDILVDYFNYMPIYFDKDPKEIKKILDDVKKEINTDKFNSFATALNTIFFSDIK